MIRIRTLCRAADDDERALPEDRIVYSVNEGLRRRRALGIRGDAQPAVRHTALPTSMRTVEQPNTAERAVRVGLPSSADGPVPVRHIAYPDMPEDSSFSRMDRERGINSTGGSHANACQPLPPCENENAAGNSETVPGRRSRRMPPDMTRQSVPPAPEEELREIPAWLRVAQQNHLPEELRHARASLPSDHNVLEPVSPPARDISGLSGRRDETPLPERRVSDTVSAYTDAGYPPELIDRQKEAEEYRRNMERRMHHGAQYVVNARQQRQAERDAGYPRHGVYASQPRAGFRPMEEARRSENFEAPAAREPERNRNDANDPFPEDPYSLPVRQPVRRSDVIDERGGAYRAAVGEEAERFLHQPRVRSVPPERTSEPEEMQDTAIRLRLPWLGLCVLIAALAVVALWFGRASFQSQTEAVLTARDAAYQALLDSHPLQYRDLIEAAAEQHNLRPAFVASIILNESSFNPNAVSSVSARGLMQLMDDTASDIYRRMNGTNEGYSFDALFDANMNVTYGCWYLNALASRFRGDPLLVAAAYHAGPTEVEGWLNTSAYSKDHLSLELNNMVEGRTKQYVTRVLRDYAIYMRLYYAASEA